MDRTAEVAAYLAGLDEEQRALFDRVERLVDEAFPDAQAVLSYTMPTFVADGFRLHVGVWRHGVSFYGWDLTRGGEFAAAHPELMSGRATLRLSPQAAAGIDDAELGAFLRSALGR